MTRSNRIARSVNDLGLGAWFGGLLAQAVGGVRRPVWPATAVAIGANLVGGALLTIGNRERVLAQRGVASLSIVRTVVMIAAIGATVAESRNEPDEPPGGRQWLPVALTGALVVMNAVQGEQQRPGQIARGLLKRLA